METKIGKFVSVDYQQGYLRGLYGLTGMERAGAMNSEEKEGYERGKKENEY